MKTIQGTITAIKGGAAEIAFKKELPALGTLLETKDQKAIFEAVEKKDFKTVRAIALSALETVEQGQEVVGSNNQITVSLNQNILGRMFDMFGNPIDNMPFDQSQKLPIYGNGRENNSQSINSISKKDKIRTYALA